MKRMIYTSTLLTAFINQTAFSEDGLLFNVDAKGLILSITSTDPNSSYPEAGIKINSPGVSLATNAPGCSMATNGYCLFPVNDKSAANIITSGMAGDVSFTLCSNGSSESSCQNYTRTLTGSLVTVGAYRNNEGQQYLPLSYTSIDAGTNWYLSNDAMLPIMPIPIDAAFPTYAILNKTYCDTTSQNCIAIGYYNRWMPTAYPIASAYAPFAYSSNNGGNNWILSYMPLPDNIQLGNSFLLSNSCDPTGQNCTAVGYYSENVPPDYTTVNRTVPFGYASSDGGKNWILSSITLPDDILQNGDASDSEKIWSLSNLGLPNDLLESTHSSTLSNVACDSSGQLCTAVGWYAQGISPNFTTFNGYLPLAYSSDNGGQTWLLSAPLSKPADAGETLSVVRLLKTACGNSGENCTALGYYNLSSNAKIPLGYSSSDGGKNWVLSNQGNLPLLPLPSDAVQGSERIAGTSFSVSCDTTGLRCVAVSIYNRSNSSNPTTSIGTVPMAYTSDNAGQIWTLREMPLPEDIWQDPNSALTLSSMSCDTSGQRCVVVGSYSKGDSSSYTTFNGQAPLSYSSSNGGETWILSNQNQPLPLPDDAATGPNSTSTALYSVSCRNNGLECNAVGQYNYVGSMNNNAYSLSYTSKNGGVTWVLSDIIRFPSDSNSTIDNGFLIAN